MRLFLFLFSLIHCLSTIVFADEITSFDWTDLQPDDMDTSEWWDAPQKSPNVCNVPAQNGCGGNGMKWLNKRLPFKDTLKPACDKHDVCYFCTNMYGWSQKQCDEMFLTDQKRLCKNKYRGFKIFFLPKCYRWVHVQYLAVRVGGAKFVVKNPPEWCEDRCVKEKYSPFKRLE